jgi:hypothetical protein
MIGLQQPAPAAIGPVTSSGQVAPEKPTKDVFTEKQGVVTSEVTHTDPRVVKTEAVTEGLIDDVMINADVNKTLDALPANNGSGVPPNHLAPLTGSSTSTLKQATIFLKQADTWPKNTESFINLHWTFVPKDGKVRTDAKGKKLYPWGGRAVRTLDEAVSEVERMLRNPSTRDIHVCMSSQREAKETTTATGWTYNKPVRGKDNAVLNKSYYLDVDCKDGGYADWREATKAVLAFSASAGLPQPNMGVKSGGGVHAHWTVDTPLPPAEWQERADALAEAVRQHNLKGCDLQCTVDVARVMRVPDTWNCKLDQKRPVELGIANPDYPLAVIDAALAPYKSRTVAPPAPSAADKPTLDPNIFLSTDKFAGKLTDEFAAGLEHEEFQIDLQGSVAPECAFTRDAYASGGKDHNEPLWNYTTLMATFAKDRREQAHLMGNQHPGYTPESTDAKFDSKLKARESGKLGWPTCKAIQAAGATQCASCPHLAAGKSPLNLVKVSKPPFTSKVTHNVENPSFADPYADFCGPEFPRSILPPILSDFVDAEHHAMGADPAALAMAAITAMGGASHADSKIKMGDSWPERPIMHRSRWSTVSDEIAGHR